MLKNNPGEKIAPIGLFDSGVGGLTVLKEIWHQLPGEEILYLADNARLPYGTKTPDEILEYNQEIHHFFESRGVKMVIMACNTSSSLALTAMQAQFSFPIIGLIQPGATAALAESQHLQIGVIATAATIASGSYEATLKALSPKVNVFSYACSPFVPMIEAGLHDEAHVQKTVDQYVAPLKAAGIDTLILGCTHYPHLKPFLQRALGEIVALIDPAIPTVERAKNRLIQLGIENGNAGNQTSYFVTGDPRSFHQLATTLLATTLPVPEVIKLEKTSSVTR